MVTEVGNDGLTDEQRAEAAREYAEAIAYDLPLAERGALIRSLTAT